jgi:hypothetical protein
MGMERRAAAGLILAAPAAAFATGGDSPKQAYFATSPLSSPFGETYTNQETRLWQELGDTEKAIFTRIATQTKAQLTEVRHTKKHQIALVLVSLPPCCENNFLPGQKNSDTLSASLNPFEHQR